MKIVPTGERLQLPELVHRLHTLAAWHGAGSVGIVENSGGEVENPVARGMAV